MKEKIQMVSLLFRNLVFTILQPGIVAGLLPYLILGDKRHRIFGEQLQLHHYLGIAIFVIGLIVMLTCILSFAIKGRGTLSPIDPTKQLVVSGLYKFSRNPMYVGVAMILIGEAVLTQSTSLWIYSVLVIIAFNQFVLLVEEPRLRKNFGEEYIQYCSKVRRWI